MICRAIAALGFGLTVAQSLAVTPVTQSTLNRRQITNCMTKKMSASRFISYNEAAKACKELMKLQNDKLAVNNDENPGTVPRR